MKRNSTTLYLISPGATTPISWVNNAPDFSNFTEPTLSVLQSSWQAFLNSGQELEVIPDPEPMPEPELVPNWDGFNATMLANVPFNQTMGAVMQIAPAVALAIPSALAQVSTNGVTAFALVFNSFCQLGQVDSEHRNEWADNAQGFNLPNDFVAIVRG
jgi:hypothetical protein